MLKLADLRKTTRKSGEEGLRTVYPRFLRDRALNPRIELAIRYLEKMLGHARRELDAEVVVGLFGDHKLARCILACLATSYRHRARTFAEVLPEGAMVGLAAKEITTPSNLRLWLFRRANTLFPGFIGASDRPRFLREAGEELGLSAGQIEQLIALDEPSHAVLVRTGAIPTAEDVRARYNFSVAAALLANAPLVRIALARGPRDAAEIRALCEQAGVRASLGARELVLHGQQDALESWARHGARLVRLLSGLLACGLPARSGEALVVAPTGGQWRFRLDEDVLGYLGAHEDATGDVAALRHVLAKQDALLTEFAGMRRAGADAGWTLRRAVEPLIAEGAVIPAVLTATRESVRASLVLAPPVDSGWQRLERLAEQTPIVALCVGQLDAEIRGAIHFAEQGVGVMEYASRGDLAALPDLLECASERVGRAAGGRQLASLIEEAARSGVLTEAALAERLGCDEEEVGERLAAALRGAGQERVLQYVEGFGLCTGAVLTRARAAAADVASLRERTDGATRVARVLGRRLREVTGASEGIECLIAYLGAA
ncbi:MAG TPA: DUF790 family protein [Ktedonobacterales bacterium]